MDKQDLDRLLRLVSIWSGSDLHIGAGSPPCVRLDGNLRQMPNESPFTAADTANIAREIMPPEVLALFVEHHEADFAYSLSGIGRFRVNAYYQQGSVSLAIRTIREVPGTIEELGLPDAIRQLADERRGMVLVTGPTGSGKTSTLAAMIDHINRTRECHIVTIEDPIEFIQPGRMAKVDQREVGFDTETFANAMRVVLRQDPDVILVGEMRDLETTSAALTAAETGHLVLSTLHTIDAAQTVNRIVNFFPPFQHGQIRISLADSLRGTVAQRLVRRADGTGRVPAVEIMTVNGRIRQCIANAELTSEIAENIRDGAYYGMQSFDQSLAKLFEEGKISLEETLENASNSHDLRLLLEKQGLIRTGEAKMNPSPAVGVSGKVGSDLVETARTDVGALRP